MNNNVIEYPIKFKKTVLKVQELLDNNPYFKRLDTDSYPLYSSTDKEYIISFHATSILIAKLWDVSALDIRYKEVCEISNLKAFKEFLRSINVLKSIEKGDVNNEQYEE